MFGKLFRAGSAKQPSEALIVWMNANARWRAFLNEIATVDGEARRIAVVHFDETLAQLEADLRDANIAALRLDAEMVRSGNIPPSDNLIPVLFTGDLKDHPGPSAPVNGSYRFIGAELWPSGERDQAVRDFAGALAGPKASIRQHAALDDALMSRFMNDTMRGLLQKLGMTDDEPIDHAMVAKSVKRAQEKIASNAVGDGPAPNAEAWFAKYARQA